MVTDELFWIVFRVSGSEEFLILYSSFIPCKDSAGGNCQDTSTLVEVRAVTVRLVGASRGPEMITPCLR